MFKKVFLVILVIFMMTGCSLERFSPVPNAGAKAETKDVKFSFANSMTKSKGADSGNSIRSILVTVKGSDGVYLFTKKEFKVYPMGQMYVSQPLSITTGDDYSVTEFYVLNDNDEVVYAAPLKGSNKEIYVHYPLPYNFKVVANGDNTVPLEVIPVLGGDIPRDFGYDGLGISFTENSIFQGLILEYLLDGNLIDSAGSNNASSNILPEYSTDRFGNSGRSFYNENNKYNYIALDKPIADSEVSISLWYNYTASRYTTLIGSNEWGYQHLVVNTNNHTLGFNNNVISYFDTALVPGTWNHLVLVKNGTDSRLYVNGKDAGHLDSNFDNANHPIKIIGNLNSSIDRAALGSLDDIRIYNRVLSGQEALSLYNYQAPKVRISFPLAGSLVNGTVMIDATAEDDNAVTMVEFYVDGSLLGVDYDAPYSYEWDSAGSFNGNYNIEVRAYDCLKNMGSATTSVRLNNSLHLDVAAISAGTYHSVALREDGRVYAWGYSAHGEVGDGYTSERRSPTEVKNLNNITAVSSGVYHTIALRSDSTVWAWGYNAHGEMGDDSTISKVVPGQVKNLSGVTAIAAGSYHNLALLEDGTLVSWGHNNYGQLGHHHGTDQFIADKVEGMEDLIAIAAGVYTSYALKSDGTVWAWGANNYGQMGKGSSSPDRYHTPQQIPGLEGITALTADQYHVHALKNDGTVWSWGLGTSGEAGDTNNINHYTPVKVVGLENIRAIEAGRNHVLAIRNDGTVWGWGLNSSGQVGDGGYVVKYGPARVKELTNIVFISAGYQHSMAVDASGHIYTWGQASNGQLGNGTGAGTYPVKTEINWLLIAKVPAGISFETYPSVVNEIVQRKVAAGYWFTNCIRDDGNIWSWGYNAYGQLGINNTTRQLSPLRTVNLENMLSIVSGAAHSLAIKADGTLWSWGYNANGQLGNGNNTNSLAPLDLASLSGITDIAGGYDHSLALREDGTVWGWGTNGNGEIGDGTFSSTNTPHHIDELENIVRIAAGSNHSLALKEDGTLWSWGYNNHGQLGQGNTLSKSSPLKIEAISDVIDIAGGHGFSLALKADGTVWSWGYNGNGELGDATTTSRSLPVQVSGLRNIVKISAAANHSLAIDAEGGLWVWGYNASSNLGDGTNIAKLTPIKLDGISDVLDVCGSTGYHHSIALKADGTIWTWGRYENGDSWYGALGNGLNQNSNIPFNVVFPN
ncbi:MAG: hypothetical protein JXR70_18805 [Spirochaetales bacterium]|nr:hypothetical protein [Spirochaetales bacterium]